MKNIPQLKSNGKHTLLYVDGKPFTMLSGEIHNSSSSSAKYMEEIVWPSLRPLNMNSVILPVYWENIEPVEGSLDFSLVDEIILQARRENTRLVLLWFGLWKNGGSTYIPNWVKLDTDRFFRVLDMSGRPTNTVSPLCAAAVEADAKVFRALMAHLREFDSEEATVIMIQVENEIGVLGPPRDFSPAAEASFSGNIPGNMVKRFGKSGTWEQAFGAYACEYFMAYHYARAVEAIILEGKAEYPLPMYVNAWLDQFPRIPGEFPSGGPVAKVADIWKLNAPSVEAYAPDIYVDYFRDVCDDFAAIEDNPLLIPETRATQDTVPFLLYTIGKHNAVCFAPFGIEDLCLGGTGGLSPELSKILNISPTAFRCDVNARDNIAYAYKTVGNMQELIQSAHENGKIRGFLQYNDSGAMFDFDGLLVKVTYNGMSRFGMGMPKATGAPLAGGMIIEIGEMEFIIAGVECRVEFLPKIGENAVIDTLEKEDGTFENGKWLPMRVLNGDEGYYHACGAGLTLIRLKLYKKSV